MSNYGWTYLSRNALRRAEHQLSGAGDGVRDEVGFLIIHQRYADYFFPGTSVLHTRIRYALFVPWIYQTLYEEAPSGRVLDNLQRAEVRLAGRLKNANTWGVIGGLNYPRPTTQPPSATYWAALGAWGILRRQDGRLPSRARIHSLIQSGHRRAKDDDGQALQRGELPFSVLPPAPSNWLANGPITFNLLPREAEFLHRQFVDLRPSSAPGQVSLLGKLAAGQAVRADTCHAPGIREIAKEDGPILRRAGYAASLAAVGRAVYAALVETLREEEDGQPTSRLHRDHLPIVVNEHGAEAARVRLIDLVQDVGVLPAPVLDVLEQTVEWLSNGARNVMTLRGAYERAECSRKQHRARLSRINGASRRFDWINGDHAMAAPLHYRWDVVLGLLGDLWAAA